MARHPAAVSRRSATSISPAPCDLLPQLAADKGFADYGGDAVRCPGDVAPVEVHHLEPGRTQLDVPSELIFGPGRVLVLQITIDLGDGPVLLPVEVDPRDRLGLEARHLPVAEPHLQVGRRQAEIADHRPRNRLQCGLRAPVGELHYLGRAPYAGPVPQRADDGTHLVLGRELLA